MIPIEVIFHVPMEQRFRVIKAYESGFQHGYDGKTQPGAIGGSESQACSQGYTYGKRLHDEREAFESMSRKKPIEFWTPPLFQTKQPWEI